MRFAITFVLVAALYGIVSLAMQPPEPLGTDAPPHVFSAERARAHLVELLGDATPRATGTPGNFAARERLVARLAEFGYEVEVQDAPAFKDRRGQLKVHNVLVTLPGEDPSGVVLLNAHYDSVRSGPGASDDGVGVAVLLEVARMLKAGPPLKNTVVFLFDDGEEVGLCGARAFCRDHPLAAEIDVVLNFEARGTSGPTFMFETSADNGWLMEVFAHAVSQPATASMLTTIYETMPNDTNLTVYKDNGIAGLNFAFIGDPQNYHAPDDDLAHVTMGSMQHHGDYALALVRAFGSLDLKAAPGEGSDVFFDVLSSFLIRWPEGVSLWLAIGLMAVVLLIARIVVRRGAAASLGLALCSWLASLVLPVALCFGGVYALQWAGFLEREFVGNTAAYSTFYWGLSLGGFWLATRIGRSRTKAWSLWVVSWSVYGLLAIVTAVMAPGTCYIFIFPLMVASVTALPALVGRRQPGLPAMLLPVLAAGVVWFPLQQMLPVALGVWLGWVLGATHALFLTTALGVTSRPALR